MLFRIAFSVVALVSAVGTATALEVKMSAATDGAPMPVISGTTNLPDGTPLLVSLSRLEAKYLAQSKAIVSNGRFITEPFSSHKQPIPPGEYDISIDTAIPAVLPATVRAVIGQKGEHLTGDLAVKSDSGTRIAYFTTVNVGGASSASADEQSRIEAAVAKERWYWESCESFERAAPTGRPISDCVKNVRGAKR